jgi:hypothetical protein
MKLLFGDGSSKKSGKQRGRSPDLLEIDREMRKEARDHYLLAEL